MRLQIDLDKQANLNMLESILNTRSPNDRLRWLMFPTHQKLFTDAVDVKSVLRRSLSFLLFIVAYFVVFISLFISLIVAAALVHFWHRIHHLHWRLLRLLYRSALNHFFEQNSPADYAVCVAVMGGGGLIFFFGLRWAWNRRADRLNRESSLPSAAVAAAPGVWPPPPTAQEPCVEDHAMNGTANQRRR